MLASTLSEYRAVGNTFLEDTEVCAARLHQMAGRVQAGGALGWRRVDAGAGQRVQTKDRVLVAVNVSGRGRFEWF